MKTRNLLLIIGISCIIGASIKSCVLEYECMEFKEFSGLNNKNYSCTINDEHRQHKRSS